jgi:hypothetical protein
VPTTLGDKVTDQGVDYHNQVPLEDDGAVKLSLNIINQNRVEVRDNTETVVGEAVRGGWREDWFVQNKSDHDGTMFLIGRVHSNHVSEVQGRKMILAMLKAFYGIDV